MSRAQALTYLVNQYTALAAVTGQLLTDTDNGFGPAIDDALLTLGTGFSNLVGATVGDGSVTDYRVLLRLSALQQFESQLASKRDFDVSSDSVKFKLSSQLQQVRAMLVEAQEEAASRGYVQNAKILRMGRVNLDFIEPGLPGMGI